MKISLALLCLLVSAEPVWAGYSCPIAKVEVTLPQQDLNLNLLLYYKNGVNSRTQLTEGHTTVTFYPLFAGEWTVNDTDDPTTATTFYVAPPVGNTCSASYVKPVIQVVLAQ